MVMATDSLKLDYGFVPSPNPIRASATGANPNTIDLQVIISNSSLSGVEIGQIQVQIPMGEDISRDLSTSANLPGPVYDPTGPWAIASAADTVTIKTQSGKLQEMTAPIVFTLPGIQVNHQPGKVPLTITEFPPLQRAKFADGTTYSLLKQPADFPVTSFYANPASLANLDQPVTLHWTVSDQGKLDLYGLRIVNVGMASGQSRASSGAEVTELESQSSAPLKECDTDGNCYTWQDGQNGVLVSSVNQTTTFALDIVTPGSSGGRRVIGTLETTVRVTMPWISQNSYLQASPSGRLVWMHWLAFNAASCSVQREGVVIDARAPADTYLNGYLTTLTGLPNDFQFSVIAHAISGPGRAPFTFPTVSMSIPPNIPVGAYPRAAAFTPDGALALVPNSQESSVTVIDVGTLTPEAKTIPVGNQPQAIAITPDGALAFTADLSSNTVTVIDIPSRTPEPTRLSIDQPSCLAVTPDGSSLLVTDLGNSRVLVVDIATRTLEATPIQTGRLPIGIAVTPDGALAFTTNVQDHSVTVIDVPARRARGAPIPVGEGPYSVAVTPDGLLALVTNASDSSVSFIDVATLQVVATVEMPSSPVSVAITSDSSTALVANEGESSLSVMDIATRTYITIGPGNATSGVGIAPDGSVALISNGGGNYVAVI
jgi:YVTN family beta-propeller protein